MKRGKQEGHGGSVEGSGNKRALVLGGKQRRPHRARKPGAEVLRAGARADSGKS